MISEIGILIPSLNRPSRLDALIDNLHATTSNPHRLHFAVSDPESVAILRARGEHYITDSGEPPESTFGNRVNRLYSITNESYFIPVGDDDEHLPGWDEDMLECMTPGVKMVVSRCTHMALISRRYIETQSGCVDTPDVVCGPYRHNFTEWELVFTANMRGVLARCPVPTVIHHRWQDGGECCVGGFEHDETYQRGDSGWDHDLAMFEDREPRLFPNSRIW